MKITLLGTGDAIGTPKVGCTCPQCTQAKETGRMRLRTSLLADEGGKVAKAFGVSAPVVGTRRAVFIVDEQGVVRHRHVHALGISYQGVEELREALAGVEAPA